MNVQLYFIFSIMIILFYNYFLPAVTTCVVDERFKGTYPGPLLHIIIPRDKLFHPIASYFVVPYQTHHVW